MWISAEQLKSVLKHHWFVTPYTESNLKYTLYNNRSNVNVYTLRLNLKSPNYNHENMIDEMIHQVMTKFPEAKLLVGSIDYDMLLVNNKEEPPSYYLWRSNSNQRSSSLKEETIFKKDYHQLYFFGKKATEVNLSELNVQFESSNVVIEDILTIVFTFSSV